MTEELIVTLINAQRCMFVLGMGHQFKLELALKLKSTFFALILVADSATNMEILTPLNKPTTEPYLESLSLFLTLYLHLTSSTPLSK